MCRKIAFGVTIVATLLLMILRLDILPIDAADITPWMPILLVAAVIALAVLCLIDKHPLHRPDGGWSTACGWIGTFGGAILAMSVVIDVLRWVVYKKIPPPGTEILNDIDLYATVLTLVFGAAGGALMVLQGFRWMAHAKGATPITMWLSAAPALWMWFRLARYEISYASTIDISKSVFEFAILIFASLFFLQFARMIAGVGKRPQGSLILYALCFGMVAVSHAPAKYIQLVAAESYSELPLLIVDTVMGVFALIYAAMQIFSAAPADDPEDKEPTQTSTDDRDDDQKIAAPADDELSTAWVEPEKPQEALDPPFDLHSKLPSDITQKKAPSTPPAKTDGKLTVDDILSEIDKTL